MNNMSKPGVWPAILYTDTEAARRFLIEVIGFTESFTVRGEDGTTVRHGELLWPEGGGVMYGCAANGHTGQSESATGSSLLYVATRDPDQVCERARAAGAKILAEPHDTDYGSRNVAIADPDGNVWTFGTYGGA